MKARSSPKDNATLAAIVPRKLLPSVSTFQAALSMYNVVHMCDCTFDQLSEDQQREVRAIAADIEAREHPCTTPLEK